MKGSKLPSKYASALNRLREGHTWQGIEDHLTDALGDGRIVFRSEVWKMSQRGKWSPKVAQALRASGDIAGPRKRFRLHAEFDTQEQMDAYMRFYGIDNKSLTFTEWAKYNWLIDEGGRDR